MESSESQTRKSSSSIKSRMVTKIKELIKEDNSDSDDENGKCSYKLLPKKNDEKLIPNQLNLSTSKTVRENYIQTMFFDMINFDKLGSFIF